MSDTVVVHLTKCAEKTTIASAKIARFLAEAHDLPLVDGPGQFKKQYRNIIYVNSMGAFAHADLRRELAVQSRNCDRLIYVQNDYNVHPISQVQKVVRDERGWSHVVSPLAAPTRPQYFIGGHVGRGAKTPLHGFYLAVMAMPISLWLLAAPQKCETSLKKSLKSTKTGSMICQLK